MSFLESELFAAIEEKVITVSLRFPCFLTVFTDLGEKDKDGSKDKKTTTLFEKLSSSFLTNIYLLIMLTGVFNIQRTGVL